MKGNAILHRAPLVVPMTGPPLADGGVLCAAGSIIAVGPFAELRGEAASIVDHEGRVLTPALVNAHAHLELSHLAALGREGGGATRSDMTGWIADLLHRRETTPASDEEIAAAAHRAVADLHAAGTILIADIGNRPETARIQGKVEALFFLEFLGLSRAAAEAGQNRLAAMAAGIDCTAHAPYSTAPELLQALHRRASAADRPFPLHVAESAEEVEFLRTGGGPFREFLEKRGVWDGSFGPPATGAVAYLDRLRVLDGRTLCVHCVHLTPAEVALLAERQAKVCLCPGSNRTLGVGRAPVAALLAAGIRPALGTDSLASNPQLSLWEEMRLLREDHPGVAPEDVFAMATANGSAALGADARLGSLAPGRTAKMLAVRCSTAVDHIFEVLTTLGKEAEIEWVE